MLVKSQWRYEGNHEDTKARRSLTTLRQGRTDRYRPGEGTIQRDTRCRGLRADTGMVQRDSSGTFGFRVRRSYRLSPRTVVVRMVSDLPCRICVSSVQSCDRPLLVGGSVRSSLTTRRAFRRLRILPRWRNWHHCPERFRSSCLACIAQNGGRGPAESRMNLRVFVVDLRIFTVMS